MARPQAASAREVAALLGEADADELGELIARYADDPRRQVARA